MCDPCAVMGLAYVIPILITAHSTRCNHLHPNGTLVSHLQALPRKTLYYIYYILHTIYSHDHREIHALISRFPACCERYRCD